MRITTTILIALACAALSVAQPTVAPTSEPVGKTRGDNLDGNNVVNSFELGYRFRTTAGDFDSYRSTVNYGNGIRLLGSSLTINSKEGHGHFFDEIVLTTQGLGNDPYESANLRIQKNGLYRYDMLWRSNDYFNPGLRTGGAFSPHLLDTIYHAQDQDLTIFPQSNIQFFFGYSRGHQEGPALSTIQLFDSRGDEFPLFENVRRVRNEYRIGNEVRFFGIKFNWIRGWEDFKEDSPFSSGVNAGANTNDRVTLTSFRRNEPYHGTSPYWRAALFSEKRWISINGRFTYTAGTRGFIMDESAFGTNRFGADQNRQVVTFGNAQRPAATGNLNISIFPSSKITVVNSTSVYNIRIDGDSVYRLFDNGSLTSDLRFFQFLGIRTVANETNLNYQVNPQFGLYGGYHYSNRLIRSTEQVTIQDSPESLKVDQTNQLHAGIAGMRIRPMKPLTIQLDGEVGRADRPLTPVSDANYHVLGARVQYKAKTVTLAFATRANYNVNSVSLSTYASHARNYSATAAWTPRDWVSLDAGYSKLHLNTAGGIDYFASSREIRGEQSLYFSNIHAANLGIRFGLRKYADLYAGYSHIQDTGDGRRTPTGSGIGSALANFQTAQTFPLRFESPLARVSIRINERLRWNVGYQYYGYRADFYRSQGFRANTGYSSILWSF